MKGIIQRSAMPDGWEWTNEVYECFEFINKHRYLLCQGMIMKEWRCVKIKRIKFITTLDLQDIICACYGDQFIENKIKRYDIEFPIFNMDSINEHKDLFYASKSECETEAQRRNSI